MLSLLFFCFLIGKLDKKKSKLKTLSDLVFKNGPIYNKIQLSLEIWKVAYKKREKVQGDDSVIKFINHFGEIKDSSGELEEVNTVATPVVTKK